MKYIGIDLAGTTNARDTAAAVFDDRGGHLHCMAVKDNLTDQDIYELVDYYAEVDQTVIGMDAPLSYQFGKGDRQSDISLRKEIVRIGMSRSSVMPPTAPGICFLTMRGIALTRGLHNRYPDGGLDIVEVHPGAAIGLHHGAQTVPQYVLTYKGPDHAYERKQIIQWLQSGMQLLDIEKNLITASSHEVDACAAALAAWKWKTGSCKWISRSTGRDHPYDFSC